MRTPVVSRARADRERIAGRNDLDLRSGDGDRPVVSHNDFDDVLRIEVDRDRTRLRVDHQARRAPCAPGRVDENPRRAMRQPGEEGVPRLAGISVVHDVGKVVEDRQRADVRSGQWRTACSTMDSHVHRSIAVARVGRKLESDMVVDQPAQSFSGNRSGHDHDGDRRRDRPRKCGGQASGWDRYDHEGAALRGRTHCSVPPRSKTVAAGRLLR